MSLYCWSSLCLNSKKWSSHIIVGHYSEVVACSRSPSDNICSIIWIPNFCCLIIIIHIEFGYWTFRLQMVTPPWVNVYCSSGIDNCSRIVCELMSSSVLLIPLHNEVLFYSWSSNLIWQCLLSTYMNLYSLVRSYSCDSISVYSKDQSVVRSSCIYLKVAAWVNTCKISSVSSIIIIS